MSSSSISTPNLRFCLRCRSLSRSSLIPFVPERMCSPSTRGFPTRWRGRSGALATTAMLRHSEHDVVIVGAGIIGICTARQLLLGSDLSVAIVDAGLPCSGATGAGQGYVWMAHKTPESESWELAMRSKRLWEELAESLRRGGWDPFELLGWKKNGSLLIGRTLEEICLLEERVKLLSQAGLRAELLPSNSLLAREPALEVGREGGAAFFPDDCQIDAVQTVGFIEKGNRNFAAEGRYVEFYNNPAICILSSERGVPEAIQTHRNVLHFKKALVIAAGAWSGSLMQSLFAEIEIVPVVPVKPRKGHLIVLENINGIQLNHGLMEVGYIDHQIASLEDQGNILNLSSISMTANMDKNGNLVLGSSRQFSGFGKEVEEPIVQCILERAAQFIPDLNDLCLKLNDNREIRVGLRPYVHDGKPMIGPIPNVPKVFLATGHEGSGLSLALGTAEMVSDMILETPSKLDCTPFSVEGRFGF